MGQAISEETVGMADKLYAARKATKFILGDRYTEFSTGMADLIRDIIKQSPRKDLSPLSVAIELAQAPGIGGHQQMMIFATAVDMTDGII